MDLKKTIERGPSRMPASERRQLIVEKAFSLIASEGFEGFRTQAVADASGVTGATLHYYFPSKQDLVEAVANHLANRYANERAPYTNPTELAPNALGQLRRQFADVEFYALHRPELLTVSREFLLRATRDPAVARVIKPLNEYWRGDFEKILRIGLQEKVFKHDLDPPATSAIIVGALWGANSLFQSTSEELRKLFSEIERLITVSE